ncbi:MAG: molybdopterin molybdotransferase MoeA [Euryarchaeota archaeon]|nr:molybdopterin molybdotransferase MoeA [Euryarchaeota archaeon]
MRAEEVLRSALSSVSALEAEVVKVSEACGRVLAQDVRSPIDLPPFTRATMDGYAVCAGDTKFAPVRLRLVEGRIGRGQAKRIATGEPLPEGADAVVRREFARAEGEHVVVLREVERWKDVSRRGEDVRRGERVLEAGTVLEPLHLGLLSGLGLREVRVVRIPRVGLIVTGDEVVEPGERLEHGKVYDMNTSMLSAEIRACGAEVVRYGIVGDERERLREVLLRASRETDLIVTTGGSSRGERDFVPEIVEELGEIKAHFLPVKPGKPMAYGVLNRRLVFALSGWAAAAWVTFEVFVKPVILKLGGRSWKPAMAEAVVEQSIPSKRGRRDFVRVRLSRRNGCYYAKPLEMQRSSVLFSLARAHALLEVPEEVERIEAGERVRVRLLRGAGFADTLA